MPTIRQCATAASFAFGLLKDEIYCRDHSYRVAHPRQAAFWLARVHGYSLPRIGRAFGLDHTTVLKGIRRCEARADADEEFGDQLFKAWMAL